MARRAILAGVMPWVWRLLVAAALLAAPIITFRAFTDEETPDPQRQQRLREVEGATPRPLPPAANTTTRPDYPAP